MWSLSTEFFIQCYGDEDPGRAPEKEAQAGIATKTRVSLIVTLQALLQCYQNALGT